MQPQMRRSTISAFSLVSVFAEMALVFVHVLHLQQSCLTNHSGFVYILALNADNLAANRVVYVAATGTVDIFAYILSIILLNFFGRKMSSCGLFGLSGFFLLSLIFVPRGKMSPLRSNSKNVLD